MATAFNYMAEVLLRNCLYPVDIRHANIDVVCYLQGLWPFLTGAES